MTRIIPLIIGLAIAADQTTAIHEDEAMFRNDKQVLPTTGYPGRGRIGQDAA